MADTIRDLTALLALYPDQTTGSISAQDLRDFVVSAYSGYGMMSVASTQTVSVTNSFSKLTVWDTAGPVSSDVTLDTSDDDITVSIAGDYEVACSMNMDTDASKTVTIAVFVNGVEDPSSSLQRKVNATQEGSSSLSNIITLAASDVVDIRVMVGSGTINMTFDNAQFFVRRAK